MADQEQAYTPVSGCLARLFWLVGGNAMLALALLQILFTQPPIFSLVDAFYGSIVVRILLRDTRIFAISTAPQAKVSRQPGPIGGAMRAAKSVQPLWRGLPRTRQCISLAARIESHAYVSWIDDQNAISLQRPRDE